jgi:hypothetical protein
MNAQELKKLLEKHGCKFDSRGKRWYGRGRRRLHSVRRSASSKDGRITEALFEIADRPPIDSAQLMSSEVAPH